MDLYGERTIRSYIELLFLVPVLPETDSETGSGIVLKSLRKEHYKCNFHDLAMKIINI